VPASSTRTVGSDLLDELTGRLGSRREAAWVLAELEVLAPPERRARALELAARRADGEPLQYVLGHWPFRSLDLLVDGRALVPRPETEGLVDVAMACVARGSVRLACDLGCGTGAIALSLATECAAIGRPLEVHATDLSTGALDLARTNAARVGVTDVAFHLGSWFDALPPSLRGRLDLVCANPPYVGATERATLARELDFEPRLALVAVDRDGTEGFAAVAEVLEGAAGWLAAGGTVLVEHGAAHRTAALARARAVGLVEAVDHEDLAGRPRVLEARRAP
jgi:release factor glutamine methyltransferase